MVSRLTSLHPAHTVTATILVAEDAPDVRRMMTHVLARAGYDVLGAINGVEAIAVADTLPRLDLLVTDLSMPGLDGVALAARLRGSRPALRVLFISGAPQGILPVELPPRSWFLPKPFGLGAFLTEVRRAIDDGRCAGDSRS